MTDALDMQKFYLSIQASKFYSLLLILCQSQSTPQSYTSRPRKAVRDQTLELMLEVDEASLERYLSDGQAQLFRFYESDGSGLSNAAGPRGVQVDDKNSVHSLLLRLVPTSWECR